MINFYQTSILYHDLTIYRSMDLKELAREFVSGGWIVTLIGALGMSARLFINSEKITIVDQIKRIVAASICSTIAWFILEQIEVSSLTKAICYGIVGVISPEIIAGIIKLGKLFKNKPTDYIKK